MSDGQADEDARIRAVCLRYLARRDYSRGELVQRLAMKGFSGSAVERVLDAVALTGEQSDRRFAESLMRRRLGQGYGPRRIAMELRQSAVTEPQDAVDIEWDRVIEDIYRRRYGSTRPGSSRELASRHRFLLRRGFTPEQIHRLLQRVDRFAVDSD